MTDPKDELARAHGALKKSAASQLARKEARAADLEKLEARITELRDGRARAEAAGDAALARDVAAALTDLEARRDLARQNLDEVEIDLQESLQNLRETESLGRTLDRATARREVVGLTEADPYAPATAVDKALGNVRDHIEELGARADVMDELQADARTQADLQRRLDALDADAKADAAQAELARLKAARRGGGAPASEESGADEPAPPAEKKPKRTL